MSAKISYRDYLISTAAHTAGALADAVRNTIEFNDEDYSIEYLEQHLATARELLRISPNPERVLPRPAVLTEDEDAVSVVTRKQP